MVRIAKPSDPRRLAELKNKIRDKYYLEMAITRIANTLTKELMSLKEDS